MKLANVYFVNGTAYAGKSTIVKALAEKYDGIACEENYQDTLLAKLNSAEFPNLTYTRDLDDWRKFVRRTPDEYEAWINGCIRECTVLELKILEDLSKQDKKVFVDTNIPTDVLSNISDREHVLIMLADPEISVNRFFDRPDKEISVAAERGEPKSGNGKSPGMSEKNQLTGKLQPVFAFGVFCDFTG